MITRKTLGIIKGPVIVAAVLVLFTLTMLTLCAPADAATAKDWRIKYPFKYAPTIEVALDYELNETFCNVRATGSGNARERLVGNIILDQIIFESVNGRVQGAFGYHHHSCAFGVDRASYDAVKLFGVKVRLW